MPTFRWKNLVLNNIFDLVPFEGRSVIRVKGGNESSHIWNDLMEKS